MKKLLLLFTLLCFSACKDHSAALQVEKTTVLFFLGPECPLCQDYSIAMESLYQTYHDKVDFLAVFSGKHYNNDKIQRYISEYIPHIKWTKDPDFAISSYYEASITPEAILLDQDGTIQYQGKIDNWLGELGRRRQKVDVFYLKDAIEAIINHKEIPIKRTKAIGCFIE